MFWKKKDKQPHDAPAASSTNPFDQSTQAPSLHFNTSSDSITTSNCNSISQYYNSNYKASEEDRAVLLESSRQSSPQRDARGPDDVYGRRNQAQQYGEEDEDAEVGGLKKQIRDIKQESLQSTRNALQKINEAEQNAAHSLNQLGTQSTQVANVNRNLDLAKAHSDRASSQADELKQLNRSIFIPAVSNPFNKGARQRRDLERLQADQAEHMAERDNIRQFAQESNARIDQANRHNTSGNTGYRRGRSQADRNRYQFEADEEDDTIEDELDENLDLLGGATARLKNMALTMNDELDSQNKQLGKLTTKVDPISSRLTATTARLNKTT